MYHGDPEHSGYVSGGAINSALLKAPNGFGMLHSLNVGGPILSVPAVCNGFIYVGLANSRAQVGELGGSLLKIDPARGEVVANYQWQIELNERDTHGFCGMGSTPSVVGGFIYFVAFNAKLYCLREDDLSEVWITDLRNRDPDKNQPIQNYDPDDQNAPAAGWSAPLVVGNRIYLGIGEGENPNLFSFVFCVDTATGNVEWVFCTNQFAAGTDNLVNHIPAAAVTGTPPAMFTTVAAAPITLGCSVWGCIAYDESLDRLYCPTGNSVPDVTLPSPGYSNGLLSLDATTGQFKAFYQTPLESNYRPTDFDIDVGGSPTLLTLDNGRRAVAVGSKNGSFFLLDADTLTLIARRQMLPTYNNGSPIPTVDPFDPTGGDQENYSGTYSTAAVDPVTKRIFIGLGGNNYHDIGPGIDYLTTPFMRVMDYALNDAWPLDDNDPPRYSKAMTGTMSDGVTPILAMYQNEGDSGLSSPAVVNDVVFMATTAVNIYAFDVADGTPLWYDQLGSQTGGMSGGYGYCLGPAICGDYVVAGGLITGGDGGILRIYGPLPPPPPPPPSGGQT
jgi:outer membrane protein assembly factor BamB